MEVHNQVEDRIDNLQEQFPCLEHKIDLGGAGNLDPSTDLGFDTLEVHTVPGVDLGVRTVRAVDPGAYTAPGVDPEAQIGTEVVPGVHIETGVDLGAQIEVGVDLEERIVP